MKKNLNFAWLALVALASLGMATSANADIVVDSSASIIQNKNLTFDASSSDKLVVVVNGEHHFGSDGSISGVTYDGVALVNAVDRNPGAGNVDIDAHDIWYLDNPGTSTGAIVVSAGGNNYGISAIGLSGTALGVGATSIGSYPGSSVDLNAIGTNSLVLASVAMGGDHSGGGGTGNNSTGAATTDGANGAVEVTEMVHGSGWYGHVTSATNNVAAGNATYSFTGVPSIGAHVIAAEFQAAPSVVPEPSSLAVLGLSGLVFLRRRRK